MTVPKQLRPHTFKPKYTQEDLDLIQEMKNEGKSRGEIFYDMMRRRPDVHAITLGRWIDGVKKQNEIT